MCQKTVDIDSTFVKKNIEGQRSKITFCFWFFLEHYFLEIILIKNVAPVKIVKKIKTVGGKFSVAPGEKSPRYATD